MPLLIPPLVTLDEFASFVQVGKYFDRQFWHPAAPEPTAGGDEVLRRIEYRWSRKHNPVTNISWFEASAYACAKCSRLPHYDELPPAQIPIWSCDWYNYHLKARGVRPDESGCRRVIGWVEGDLLRPDATRHDVGFRIIPSISKRPEELKNVCQTYRQQQPGVLQ